MMKIDDDGPTDRNCNEDKKDVAVGSPPRPETSSAAQGNSSFVKVNFFSDVLLLVWHPWIYLLY